MTSELSYSYSRNILNLVKLQRELLAFLPHFRCLRRHNSFRFLTKQKKNGILSLALSVIIKRVLDTYSLVKTKGWALL